MTVRIKDEEFIEVVKHSSTMREASIKLGLAFSTFKRKADILGIYKSNQGRTGLGRTEAQRKVIEGFTIPLEKIFSGEIEYSHRTSLKRRMINEGHIVYECNICKIKEWNNKKLSLELDHINGINNDNRKENLRLLCPNCHSQQDTSSGRNKKYFKKWKHIPDNIFLDAYGKCGNITAALRELGLNVQNMPLRNHFKSLLN